MTPPKLIVDDHDTLRVSPNAAVNAVVGQPVQPGLFLGEHLHRRPPGDPMRPGVDLVGERLAGGDELGPAA